MDRKYLRVKSYRNIVRLFILLNSGLRKIQVKKTRKLATGLRVLRRELKKKFSNLKVQNRLVLWVLYNLLRRRKVRDKLCLFRIRSPFRLSEIKLE